MKLGILFILVLSLFHTAAFGDMSVTDLEKIRDITKDSEMRVRAELTAVEKRLKEEIVASEERSKEFTSHETAKVGISVNAVKEQLNWNFLLVLALIGLFGVILGLPYLQQRKNEREQAEKIAAQQREIEELQKAKIAQQRQLEAMQKELEALKQNQMPSA